MNAESLIAFNLVLLAALASPGAAMLYVIKTTVSAGRVAGLFTGVGLATAAALWTLSALLGLESLFALFPWTYTSLKIGGALYLLWLAWQTWQQAKAPLSQAPVVQARQFIAGVLVNLGNPKSMLFAAAVIVVVFPKGMSAVDIALIVVNHWMLEIVFYTVFVIALSTPAAKRGYLALKPIFDRIAASLLGLFGLRLLLER
ncbi:MAG: LysE family transporter [Pseudomonadota bacterium]